MAASQARQNFHTDSEAAINRQINLELYASYVYHSMAMYCNRDDVALAGFEKFFKGCSGEERACAENLMKYQNKRGGRIVLQQIQKPDRDEWGTGLEMMQATLTLEKSINQSLLDLHKIAVGSGDASFEDFVEDNFLEHQVEAIKLVSDYVTQLKSLGAGQGEWHFDQMLQK